MTLMVASAITVVKRYIMPVDRSLMTCGRMVKDFIPCPVEEERYYQYAYYIDELDEGSVEASGV